jgi:hypothetical protein
MRKISVYLLPNGDVATRLRTVDQQNRRITDSWSIYLEGELVLVGQPPLDNVHLIDTIEVANEP